MTPPQKQLSLLDNDIHVALKSNNPQEAPPPQMSSNERRRWPWVFGLCLVAASGGGWYLMNRQAEPVALAQQAPSFPPRAVAVTALEQGQGQQQVLLLGQAEAHNSTELRSRVDGVIQELLVQTGDAVQAGQTIAILDDIDQQLALAQAEAELAQGRNQLAELEEGTRPEVLRQRQASVRSAEALEREAMDNLERIQTLVDEGAISQQSLIEAQSRADRAQEQLFEAEAVLAEAIAGPRQEAIAAQAAVVRARSAAVNQARTNLERTQIKAPLAGIVQDRMASIGDFLETGDTILTLINDRTLDVFLEVPEELSGQVQSGLPVTLTARSLPDWTLTMPITAVGPAADPTSRRQQIRLRLENPPQGLLPGTAIQGALTYSTVAGWNVSRDALTRRGEGWVVYVIDNEAAREVAVELAADMGETVTITGSGLQGGQPVVVQGSEGLQDGAPVQVTNQ